MCRTPCPVEQSANSQKFLLLFSKRSACFRPKKSKSTKSLEPDRAKRVSALSPRQE
jgi:hypothetical protein